jgi:ribose transport system permease protein
LLYGSGFGGQILGPVIRNPILLDLGGGKWGFFPVPFVVLLVVATILQIALFRSLWGLRLYAVGGSEMATRVAGIKTKRLQIGTYVLSGALAALAGIILSSWVGSGSAEQASGMEFESIAAFILGGGALFAGTGSIYGSLVGALVITGLKNGLSLANVASPYQWMIIGAVFLLAVGVNQFSRSKG